MSSIEVTITHDDQSWVLRHADLTALDERDCRNETGFTITEILGFVDSTKPGLDTLAALEWIARRQNGDRAVSYLDVAKTITNASAITVDWRLPDEEPERPE